jgi:hypothetical protein
MTVVRPEWIGAEKLGPAKLGPEIYAPPERRTPQKPSAADNIPFVHRQRNEADPAHDPAQESLNALIRRVASASMEGIDQAIRELESVRDMLRKEGERVTREISGYASLSHASITAMKVISDSIKQWKDARDQSA